MPIHTIQNASTLPRASFQRRRPGREPLTGGPEAYAELAVWRQEYFPWLLKPGAPAIFFRLIASPEAVPMAQLCHDGEPVKATDLFRRLARSSFCDARGSSAVAQLHI
jgi:hypothetical protein